jgi:oxygen-independent coproporphyrinogen-3 oxidase
MIKIKTRGKINKAISSLDWNAAGTPFLYVNYPFCSTYCRFCIYKICRYNEQSSALFLKHYAKEAFFYERALAGFKFKNIHIGGGTPTLVPLRSLIDPLKGVIDPMGLSRFVIETFPEGNLKGYFDELERYQMIKVQLGVQTLNEHILKGENRPTSRTDILDCLKRLSRSSLIWSVDLVYGFKDENKFKRDYLSEIKTILAYRPHGIHIYYIRSEAANDYYYEHPSHRLLHRKKEDKRMRFGIDISQVTDILSGLGYKKIGDEWCLGENIKYAQKTICYDSQAEMIPPSVLGIGLGAKTSHRSIRYKNTDNPSEYGDLIEQGYFPVGHSLSFEETGLYPIVCFLKRFRSSLSFNFAELSSSVSLSRLEEGKLLGFIDYLEQNGLGDNLIGHEYRVASEEEYAKTLHLAKKYIQGHIVKLSSVDDISQKLT